MLLLFFLLSGFENFKPFFHGDKGGSNVSIWPLRRYPLNELGNALTIGQPASIWSITWERDRMVTRHRSPSQGARTAIAGVIFK